MLKRRIAFATPLVFVVGCKHPVETTRDPDPHVVVTTPKDAKVADPVVDTNAQLFVDMCSAPDANCNPPIPTPDARPEPTLKARVALSTPGKGAQKSIVIIPIGSRHGVLPSWKGELFYGAQRLGTFTILKIEDGKTTGYSDADPSVINGRCHVQFEPPK